MPDIPLQLLFRERKRTYLSYEPVGIVMLSIPILDALFLTALFGIAGLLHLAGPDFLQSAYRRWGFPINAHRVIGTLSILAALFLSNPLTRIWGVIVAGFLIFFSTLALFHRRKYVLSVPGLILLAALVPASLAGPL